MRTRSWRLRHTATHAATHKHVCAHCFVFLGRVVPALLQSGLMNTLDVQSAELLSSRETLASESGGL